MRNSGFTLIEVLVVASITIVITGFLMVNFSETKLNLDHTMNLVVADIRDTQTKAITSATYNSTLRCGYGVSYVNATTFKIYTSPTASNACSTYNRNYEVTDTIARTVVIRDQGVEFRSSFSDIFFEPPDPATFINNIAGLSTPPVQIVIRRTGADCATSPGSCRIICVYPSSRIDTATGATCP